MTELTARTSPFFASPLLSTCAVASTRRTRLSRGPIRGGVGPRRRPARGVPRTWPSGERQVGCQDNDIDGEACESPSPDGEQHRRTQRVAVAAGGARVAIAGPPRADFTLSASRAHRSRNRSVELEVALWPCRCHPIGRQPATAKNGERDHMATPGPRCHRGNVGCDVIRGAMAVDESPARCPLGAHAAVRLAVSSVPADHKSSVGPTSLRPKQT